MCRLMAYIGDPLLLSDVVLWPDRSIIKQSYDARERLMDPSLPAHLKFGNLNADGFGIGWYPKMGDSSDLGATPCVFTSITPAWNNHNLSRISSKVISGLVFAHVRAAYPGMPVSEQNCHPFQYGRYMFMHNGVIDGFSSIRRTLVATLSDAAYDTVQSFHSDSALSFSLFLHNLPDLHSKQSPETLLRAMEATVAMIGRIQEESGITGISLLNFVVSDGESMVVSRFVSPETQKPASLYYAEGNRFCRSEELKGGVSRQQHNCNQLMRSSETTSLQCEGSYALQHAEQGPRTVIVASEPITGSRTDWVAIPPNTALVISQESDGYLSIIQTPITLTGKHKIQKEVSMCLDAVNMRSHFARKQQSLNDKSSSQTQQQQQKNQQETTIQQKQYQSVQQQQYVNGCYFDSEDDNSSYNGGESPRRDPKHILSGHKGCVLSMVTQDNMLVTAGVDKIVRVWDLITFRCIAELKGCLKPISKLAILQEKIFTISGRALRIWDLPSKKCVTSFSMKACRGVLRAIAVGLDQKVYLGFQNGLIAKVDYSKQSSIHVQDFEPQVMTSMVDGHRSSVYSLVICGTKLCSCGGDGMIRIWKLSDLKPITVLRGHRGSVLILLAIGSLLLSGGRDGVVRVWDMDTLLMRATLQGHKSEIIHISAFDEHITENGNYYARNNTTTTKNVHLERLNSESQYRTSLVATAEFGGIVRLWMVGLWQCVRMLDINVVKAVPQALLSTAIMKKTVATAGASGEIQLWEIEDLTHLMEDMTAAISSDSSLVSLDSKLVRSSLTCIDDWGMLEVERRIEKEMERALRKLVALRTVSCDSTRKEECFRGAKNVAELLESIGCAVELQRPGDDKNPVVLGRLGHKPGIPTVTFYGHYDVQPAVDPDWTCDPFRLSAKDGYFYGRGTSDNKGPVIAFIYAIKQMVDEKQQDSTSQPGLPCNIAFVIEGEEENGNTGFKEVLEKYAHWFEGTKVIIISNTQWAGENVPCLTYGLRGMITMTVEITGPERELHSGNDGGVFNEPMSDLVRVLGTLVDSHSQVNVPGFYSNVRNDLLEPALNDLKNSTEFSVDGYKSQLGVPALTSNQSMKDILLARWCKPTLSLVDIHIGSNTNTQPQPSAQINCFNHDLHCYRFGPTLFSVIPKSVRGQVSVRFVPDQQPQDLIHSLRHHFQHEFAKLHSRNKINVTVKSIGDFWQADTKSCLFKLAEEVVEKEWGVKPLHVREGGTMPVAATLEKVIGAPALMIPMGQQSDNCHLANERIRCINLYKGKNTICRFLQKLGELAELKS